VCLGASRMGLLPWQILTRNDWEFFWGVGEVSQIDEILLLNANFVGFAAVIVPLSLYYGGAAISKVKDYKTFKQNSNDDDHSIAHPASPRFPASFSYTFKAGWPLIAFVTLNTLVAMLVTVVAIRRRAYFWFWCGLAMGIGNTGMCVWPVPPVRSRPTDRDLRFAEVHLRAVLVTFLLGIAPTAVFGFGLRGWLVVVLNIVGLLVLLAAISVKLHGDSVFRGPITTRLAMRFDSDTLLAPEVRWLCCLGEWAIIIVAVLAIAAPPDRPFFIEVDDVDVVMREPMR